MKLSLFKWEYTAVILALAWMPVLLRFLKRWWRRRNPVSSAIVLLILFASYVNIGLFFVYYGVSSDLVRPMLLIISALVCGYFHWAFYRLDRKIRRGELIDLDSLVWKDEVPRKGEELKKDGGVS